MPSSSHQFCAEPGCKIRIHKQNRYGRCYAHYRDYEKRLQQERRRIKKVRAERRMAPLSDEVRSIIDEVAPRLGSPMQIDMTTFSEITQARLEGPVVVDPVIEAVPPSVETERRKYRSYPLPPDMSDDTKQEILLHYENMDIPVTEICRYFKIGSPSLLGLIEEFGVVQRAKRPDFVMGTKAKGHFEKQDDGHSRWVIDAQPVTEPTVPEPQRKALENMLQPPPVVDEPEERYVPARVTTTPRGGPVWKVTLTTTIEVRGTDIDAALSVVRRSYPQARITSMQEIAGTTV